MHPTVKIVVGVALIAGGILGVQVTSKTDTENKDTYNKGIKSGLSIAVMITGGVFLINYIFKH